MTTDVGFRCRLSVDELLSLTEQLGIAEIPTVLALRSRHGTIDARDAAMARAHAGLSNRGLVVDGAVDTQLAAALNVMQRPHREIAVRWITPHGSVGISATRAGVLAVHARRVGEHVDLSILRPDNTIDDVLDAVTAELPASRPAEVEPVGAPLLDMAECLSGSHDARALTDRIRALGASARAAVLLGAALAERQAFAEIVYYQLVEDDGLVGRCPSAVAVFYTARGRVISVPSRSPAGEMWVTLKPGTEATVRQAIRQLVELSDDGWEERRTDYGT